ncbi:MAG: hypothetical protein K8R60_20970 [Burkholderiales bacterium]|nr:hypothetical protein [Burkholderiales bacterium]
MASRLELAKQDIVETFEKDLPHILRVHDFAGALSEYRDHWRLAVRTSFATFEEFMLTRTKLRRESFEFKRPVTGYVWGEVPLLRILLGLIEHSHLSHYTAVRIHGLTEQVPATVYITRARTSAGQPSSLDEIDQAAIDTAFQRPPRQSSDVVRRGDIRIVLLQGAQQGEPGITSGTVDYDGNERMLLRYTTLERTLIDIAVRPTYAGGVFEVAKAYENAREREELSVNTMSATLRRMNLTYPYHQAVGYYLERANFKASLVDLFKSQPKERDFYLTHEMGRTRYLPEWRLHVPEGL